MTIPVWPEGLRALPRRNSWTGGPLDLRRRFTPDRGEDQFRRATTAEVMVYEGAVFPNIDRTQRDLFEAFFRDDLQGGVVPFAWPDPVTGEVWLWRIAGDGRLAYTLTAKGADNHDLTLSLHRRPGRPWWSAYVPSFVAAVPDLVADFVGGTYGVQGQRRDVASLIAVTRTGTATRVNEAGLVVAAAADTLRIDHDPVTLAPRGLLVEPARTNLLTRSSEFDHADWTKVNATVTANDGTAPDGTAAADRLVVSSASLPRAQQVRSLSAVTHSFSLYAKGGSASFLQGAVETGGDALRFFVNLASGATQMTTTGSWGTPAVTAQAAGNGWYRIVVTFTATAASHTFSAGPSSALGSTSGTVGQGLLVWGAQVEAGAFATSLIPTAGSTLSRGVEKATATDPLLVPLANAPTTTQVVRYGLPWTAEVGLILPPVSTVAATLSIDAGGAGNPQIVSRLVAFAREIAEDSMLEIAA